MTSIIILEDGTGVSNSNSYVTTASAIAYHTLFGNDAFVSADTPTQELSLVAATQAIDLIYGPIFIGYKGTKAQALAWPRLAHSSTGMFGYGYYGTFGGYYAGGLRDNYAQVRLPTEIPVELQSAVFEFALQYINGEPLIRYPVAGVSNVIESSVTIDVIKLDTKYIAPVSQAMTAKLNMMLYPVINMGNKMVRG